MSSAFVRLPIDYRKGVGAKAPTLGYAEGGRGGTTAPPSFGSALVPFLIDSVSTCRRDAKRLMDSARQLLKIMHDDAGFGAGA